MTVGVTSYKAAMRGVPVVLLSEEQDDETTSDTLGIPDSFARHKLSVTGQDGVASGVVTIETAPNVAYAGIWNKLTDITVVDVATLEYAFEGIYSAIRARISTAIGTGTVTVSYVGS